MNRGGTAFFVAIAVGIAIFVAMEVFGTCLTSQPIDLALGERRGFGCGAGKVRYVDAMQAPVVEVTCDGRSQRLLLMSPSRACGHEFRSERMWTRNGKPQATILVESLE